MQKTRQETSRASFSDRCRASALRITPQRVAVYEELCRSQEHPSAERLHAKVKKRLPNISLDTVNRTLGTFARIGLAEIVEGHGNARRYDPNLNNHHHIHCVRCGAVLDFYNTPFDDLKIPSDITRKFKILGKRVVLMGICARCRRL